MTLSRITLTLFVAVGAAHALVACAGKTDSGSPHACTLIGCGPAVRIRAPLPGSFAAIRTYKLDVCWNEQCVAGSFAKLDGPPSPGAGIGISMPGPQTPDPPLRADATVWSDGAGGFEIDVTYWVNAPADLHDGDRYALTVSDPAGKTVTSVTRAVSYQTSYPNGQECGPECRSATIDTRGGKRDGGPSPEPDASANPDAPPPSCVIGETSSLPHVHVVPGAGGCVFTLAQARAGISIPYDVVIDQDVPGFTPTLPYPYGADVAGLDVSEVLQGGGQRYCLCDQGLPYASCPEADGGSYHAGSASCGPITLAKGVHHRSFDWDGVNWTGPSDTGNPKGAPFPPGDYRLEISTAAGTIAGDGGGAALQASAELLVRIVQ